MKQLLTKINKNINKIKIKKDENIREFIFSFVVAFFDEEVASFQPKVKYNQNWQLKL